MEKSAIRQAVWTRLEESSAARFPFPVTGRIPNFAGADRAARRIEDFPAWARATGIKANPDYAQYPVRTQALGAGLDVYVAVPRLAQQRCFLHLDPTTIDRPSDAATISGATEQGTAVGPDALPTRDLIVVGSVAVTETGIRVGKGEGYSDLEYAILQEVGCVTNETEVVTTVHELQVIDAELTPAPYDVPVDTICTPERTITVDTPHPRPSGVDWDRLNETDMREKPVLELLRSEERN